MLKKLLSILAASIIIITTGAGCQSTSDTSSTSPAETVRVGYFSNITHAQALVGLADGTFQNELGTTTIEPFTFNAGPTEIEALFADEIDIAYIGPSPALNGFVQSQGEALKIISGSMSGGASFVVQPELAAAYRADGDTALAGKTFSSPQQGNTQDVSLRVFLQDHGMLDQASVSPMANADQLTLFKQKQIDGSWAPEPWASRLVQEGGGELLIDERTLWPDNSFATTVVIVRSDFLEEHPETVKQWLQGHVKITKWIQEHPTEAQALANQQIEELTGSALSEDVLKSAWSRLDPTVTPDKASIETFREDAENLDFIQSAGLDFNSLYDFSILSSITGEQY